MAGVSAHTWQKTDRPHPCHPWTKRSPKLVSNRRKDTEKQPYICAVNGTAAMSRCAGASRAKIETSWSLRLKGVKRLYEMNVTVETIRTNIRIPCLRVSCPFGGVARVARERGHDCQRRRGESRSLARSFAASRLAIIRELDRRLIMPPGFTHLCRICHCLLYFLGRCNSRRNTWL